MVNENETKNNTKELTNDEIIENMGKEKTNISDKEIEKLEEQIKGARNSDEIYLMVKHTSDDKLVEIINRYLDTHDLTKEYKEILNKEYLYEDLMDAAKNKKYNRTVQKILGNPTERDYNDGGNNITDCIRYVQLLLIFDKFKSKNHKPMMVTDRCSAKQREIIKPDFQDEQIIHHALIRVLQKNLTKGMYEYTCASIPNRGIHYAKSYVERCLRDRKNTKYVLKLDIKKFFNNIPHRTLKQKIKRVIKDENILRILFAVIDSVDKGLPLGFYTSQWLANFYLQDIDHYIKERILEDCGCNVKRTNRHGAVYYVRYMDDMVIFGPNKRELRKMKFKLAQVLKEDYGLTIKDNWEIFRFDHIDKNGKRHGKHLDFVGFKFYSDKVIIRERIYRNIRKLEKKLCNKIKNNDKISLHEACSMLSYYGFIKWSDTDMVYRKYLEKYVTLNQLKEIIRNELKIK